MLKVQNKKEKKKKKKTKKKKICCRSLGCCRDTGSIPGPVQWVKGSGIATAMAQVTAAAQIQSLGQKLPQVWLFKKN